MNNREPWNFCETPKEKCTMNYCDENGCQNRKRNYIHKDEVITSVFGSDTKLLHLLAKGHTYKEAGKELNISASLIEKKLATMRKEYHCRNNVHLFVKLTKVGII